MKNWSESDVLLPVINQATTVEPNSSFGAVAVIALVILFLTALVWLLLKRGNRLIPLKKSPIQMKVLNHLPLGPKKYLTLVEVAGETLLLGVTDTSVNFIKSLALLDEDVETRPQGRADQQFAQVIVDQMIQTAPNTELPKEAKTKTQALPQDEFQITRIAEVVKDRIHTMGPLP